MQDVIFINPIIWGYLQLLAWPLFAAGHYVFLRGGAIIKACFFAAMSAVVLGIYFTFYHNPILLSSLLIANLCMSCLSAVIANAYPQCTKNIAVIAFLLTYPPFSLLNKLGQAVSGSIEQEVLSLTDIKAMLTHVDFYEVLLPTFAIYLCIYLYASLKKEKYLNSYFVVTGCSILYSLQYFSLSMAFAAYLAATFYFLGFVLLAQKFSVYANAQAFTPIGYSTCLFGYSSACFCFFLLLNGVHIQL